MSDVTRPIPPTGGEGTAEDHRGAAAPATGYADQAAAACDPAAAAAAVDAPAAPAAARGTHVAGAAQPAVSGGPLSLSPSLSLPVRLD